MLVLAKHVLKEEGPSIQAASTGSGAKHRFRFGT